jgi:hypothetical protein
MNKWINDERNLSHLSLHAALIAKVMGRQQKKKKAAQKVLFIVTNFPISQGNSVTTFFKDG